MVDIEKYFEEQFKQMAKVIGTAKYKKIVEKFAIEFESYITSNALRELENDLEKILKRIISDVMGSGFPAGEVAKSVSKRTIDLKIDVGVEIDEMQDAIEMLVCEEIYSVIQINTEQLNYSYSEK